MWTGVWVEDRKIASIGVHVSRGVSMHGFAVNVDNDLTPFEWVVACGLPTTRMTSLAAETGRDRAAAVLPQARRVRLRAAARPPSAADQPGAAGRGRAPGSLPRGDRAGPARPPDPLPRQPGRDGPAHRPRRAEVLPFRSRKPEWFKVPAPGGERYRRLRSEIEADDLHTVCQEAACPNIGDCWERGTATFMILGDTCTRRCGFCNVKTGKPTWNDPLEPARVARSRRPHGPAPRGHHERRPRRPARTTARRVWCGVIRSIRLQAPDCKVEVLTPDFRGEEMPLARVVAERPDVFNHNVEVVPRLYPVARRGSRWERSLRVLRNAKELGGDAVATKSGFMVGLGESFDELVDALGQLREQDVQIITVGQYLRPTERHLPVVRYWHPDEFKAVEAAGYALGFDHIAAGPLVRSSYHADEHVPQERPGVGPLAALGCIPSPAAGSGARVRRNQWGSEGSRRSSRPSSSRAVPASAAAADTTLNIVPWGAAEPGASWATAPGILPARHAGADVRPPDAAVPRRHGRPARAESGRRPALQVRGAARPRTTRR